MTVNFRNLPNLFWESGRICPIVKTYWLRPRRVARE